MRSLGKRISLVQFRVRAPFRNRASVQAGIISQLRRGQHSGLRPFRLLAAAAGFLCKKVAPGQHRREAPFVFARVVQQKRHDVENVASAGANPAASTTFLELKPQQTGTGLLIRYGEVATTSGSTSLRLLHSVWRRLPRQSAKRVGGLLITCSPSAWQATFLPGRLIAGHRPLKASVVVRVHPRQPLLRSPLAQNESGSLTN